MKFKSPLSGKIYAGLLFLVASFLLSVTSLALLALNFSPADLSENFSSKFEALIVIVFFVVFIINSIVIVFNRPLATQKRLTWISVAGLVGTGIYFAMDPSGYIAAGLMLLLAVLGANYLRQLPANRE